MFPPDTIFFAKVHFYVGPDEDHMRKVILDEGDVVELNNQAKHAVTNAWSQDRIHLILDYIDVSTVRSTGASSGVFLV